MHNEKNLAILAEAKAERKFKQSAKQLQIVTTRPLPDVLRDKAHGPCVLEMLSNMREDTPSPT
jgi:hypothetical protein